MSTRLRYRIRADRVVRNATPIAFESVASRVAGSDPVAAPESQLVPAARRLARAVLRALPERWRHTMGVAARAGELTDTVAPGDRATLIAAAWLHDIGYAPSIQDSGFHPLDGARFLRREGWPERVSALVAHHSGARFMASANGYSQALRQFEFERSAVSDALTYADQTVGARGQRLDLESRLADTLRRHGPESTQARIHHIRAPYLRAAADRVRRRFRRTS